MNGTSLSLRDWFAVIALSFLLLSLGILSHFSNHAISSMKTAEEHALIGKAMIEIHVQGAVEHPGLYVFSSGISLEKILEQVKLLPHADTDRLKLLKKYTKSAAITIPRIKTLTIYLEGAVNQTGAFEVKPGTRLKDLNALGLLKENANVKALNKKRKLKMDEVVKVPYIIRNSEDRSHSR